jgi:hypothetical protein
LSFNVSGLTPSVVRVGIEPTAVLIYFTEFFTSATIATT